MKIKSLYITSLEPSSGTLFIGMGFMDLLRRKVKNIAFFRPIILVENSDDITSFMLKHYKLDISAKQAYGFTLDEIKSVAAKGKLNELTQNLIAKFKELEKKYDFVLCAGIERSFLSSVFDFDINLEFAKHLGAPVVNIINGKGFGSVQAAEAINIQTNIIKKANCAHLSTFINRLDTNTLKELKTNGHELLQTNVPVYMIPEVEELSSFNIEDIRTQIKPDGERKIALISEFFGKHVKIDEVEKVIDTAHIPATMTPIMFEYILFEKARQNRQRIVLPESNDDRILRASEIILKHDVADIILLGNPEEVKKRASTLGIDINKAAIIEPEKSKLLEQYINDFYELRKSKGVTLEQSREIMQDCSYFGTMMVYKGDADGMVSGAIHTTGDTIRPALQIIKTKPGISIISSIFFMCLDTKVLVYGDCAVNKNPSAEELAEIAVSSTGTAKSFGIEPKVAMLSYSTGNSGSGEDVEKVRRAAEIVKEKYSDILIEGPIQYDAAVDLTVAKTKLPDSKVAGNANVFIFPDLNTGNNTYKAVQRSSGALAIGPVLQGLKKPVNDLSRGCLVADVVNTVVITAIQAAQIKTEQ
ncbi:MAG: phosphate acetyltransferase [Campylobacteraceae bacterium]|jgi:phosphate acetyltransferase|nr:phosphate acetyltransferase [Campylobacteraceae bacterium]